MDRDTLTYGKLFVEKWTGNKDWLWGEVTFANGAGWHNYYLWLGMVSVFFFVVEIIRPWRKDQPVFRKDFWLDFFYMYFNFFLFGLIVYNAASEVVVKGLNDGLIYLTGFNFQDHNPIKNLPFWAILVVGFVIRDFTQWWIHRLLHRVNWLWEFHKVHHSVEQMGFAAHLRYHWMENVVYRTLEYLPLALLGIGLHDFFIIHIFALALGHYNHSNLSVHWRMQGFVFGTLLGMFVAFTAMGGWWNDWRAWAVVAAFTAAFTLFLGRFLKYVFNGPANHIWHHAHNLPEPRRYGVNFALSLSCWDYLFGTIYIPKDGRNIRLGFRGLSSFSGNFFSQSIQGLFIRHKANDNE